MILAEDSVCVSQLFQYEEFFRVKNAHRTLFTIIMFCVPLQAKKTLDNVSKHIICYVPIVKHKFYLLLLLLFMLTLSSFIF